MADTQAPTQTELLATEAPVAGNKITLDDLLELYFEQPKAWRGDASVMHDVRGMIGSTAASVTLSADVTAGRILREAAAQVDHPGSYLIRLVRLGQATARGRFSPLATLEITQSMWELVRQDRPAPTPSSSSSSSSSTPWGRPASAGSQSIADIVRQEIAAALGTAGLPSSDPMTLARQLLADQDARTERMVSRMMDAVDKERERSVRTSAPASSVSPETFLELGRLRAQVEAPAQTSIVAAVLPSLLDRPLERVLAITEKMVDSKLEVQRTRLAVEKKRAAVEEAKADRELLAEAQRARAVGIDVSVGADDAVDVNEQPQPKDEAAE